jgi:predicted lipoprotein with Yx(FWY)xxD motif
MRKYIVSMALAAGAALALSACGAIDLTKKDATPANDPAPAASTSNAETSTGGTAAAGLRAVDSTLGRIVTDAKGWTLYRFDRDTAKPAKTNCVDACATKWPPVPYADNLKLDGVVAALIGKVQRPDGSWQVTINGWPVYRYAGDTKPGATSGQGVGGTWWAVTPEGKKAQPPASPTAGY